MLIFNRFQLSHLSAFSQDWQFPRLEKCQISFPSPDADATTRCHNIPFQKLRESDMMNEASDTSQVGPRSMLVLMDSHFDVAKHIYKFSLHIIQSLAVSKGETPLWAPHVNHPLPFDFRIGQEENPIRLTLPPKAPYLCPSIMLQRTRKHIRHFQSHSVICTPTADTATRL